MAEEPAEPIFLDDLPGPATRNAAMPKPAKPVKPVRGWSYWLPRLLLLGLFFIAVCVELWGMAGVALTRSRLDKLVALRVQTVSTETEGTKKILAPELTLEEIRQSLVLAPREWTTSRGETRTIGFSWPSLFSGCHLRVKMSLNGQIQAVDTPATIDDDFTETLVSRSQFGMTPGSRKALPQPPQPVVVSPPVQQPLRPTPPPKPEVNLVDALREGSAQPLAPLPPGILVFPFADASDKTHKFGSVLATNTSYMLAFTGRPLLGHDPHFHASTLVKLNLMHAGWKLDADRRNFLKAMVGAKQTVRSTLVEEGPELVLTSHFETDLPGGIPAEFVHRVPATDSRRLPVLLARDLISHLKIEWSKTDDARLETSGVETEEQLEEFQNWLRRWNGEAFTLSLDKELKFRKKLHCLMIADIYEDFAGFYKRDNPKEDPWMLKLHSFTFNKRDDFVDLFKLAPLLRDHPHYHKRLCRAVMALSHDSLVDMLLQRWEQDDPSTTGHSLRGALLIEWAWGARGGGLAGDVTEEGWRLFGERIERARKALELATRDPKAWSAHCHLITVGKASGAETPDLHEHLRAAAAILPDNAAPYLAYFNAIQKRWGGDRESRLAFARECLDTGEWQAGIPHYAAEVLFEETAESIGEGTSYGAWKTRALWSLMAEYGAAAERQPHEVPRNVARVNFLTAGIRGEHFDEVVPAMEWMASLKEEERVGWTKGKDIAKKHRFDYFRDLVGAHRTDGKADVLATARIALVEGRNSAAERALDPAQKETKEAEAGSEDVKAEFNRLRQALEWAKTYERDGKLELTPQQIWESCVEYGPAGRRPLKSSPHWSVSGGMLVWKIPEAKAGEDRFTPVECMLLLPFGTKLADLEGSLELLDSPSHQCELVLHAQGLRDSITIRYLHRKIWAERKGQAVRRDPVSIILKGSSAKFLIQTRRTIELVQPIPGETWELAVFDNAASTLGIKLTGGPGTKYGLGSIRIANAE